MGPDPDSRWREAVYVATAIRDDGMLSKVAVQRLGERLAELVLALDVWAADGGSAPSAFKRK